MKDTIPHATHEGGLKVGEGEQIPCAVLSDGTRLLSLTGVYKALGRPIRSTIKEGNRVINMPSFLDANNLQPFVSQELREVINPVTYKPLTGPIKEGYNATILPLVCDVYLAARQDGALTKKQEPVAMQAEILVRSLSKLGIIALVDEATGYQYDREKDELQKILGAYISEELLPWQKKFPDSFYKELFRLNGWRDYTVSGIKKRPGVIGKWTTTLIYEQLPKGVLKELREKTPKNASGNYTAKLHQSLTEDVGNPHLAAQIYEVLTLFRLSDNMGQVWSQFAKLNSRKSGQLELPFDFDKKGHTVDPPQPIDESTLSDFNRSLKKALDFNPKEDN